MSFRLTRIIGIILVVAMLFALVTACKNNTEEDQEDFVYAPLFIEIPGEPDYINAYAFSEDKVYFATPNHLSSQGNFISNKIQTISFDGTDLTELQNYAPDIPDADYGGFSLYAMTVDGDGNIWICEGAWLYNFNLPDDFDGEEYEKYEYAQLVGSYEKLKKLDNTGNTLLSVDLDGYSKSEYSRISSLLVDKDGNIFALVEGVDDGSILIFNKDGAFLSKIDISGWSHSLIRLLDGTIAYGGYSQVAFEFSIRKIDISSGSLGDKLDTPLSSRKFFSGTAEFLFLCSDDTSLFGVDPKTGEAVHLLYWLDCGINPHEFQDLTMLPDGRIATITSTWNNSTHTHSSSLVILTKVPRSELPNKTVLTLATFHVEQSLQNAIREFNNTNPNYRIQVIDYSEFNTDDDWRAGITRLSTEIITGNAPDMINMSQLPINQYVAKGLLLDLYELIDADPELKRDDFVSAALRAAEINGGLYQIFPFFRINTLIGNPEFLGHEPGWTIEELKAVIEANPDADHIMGLWMTSETFLFLLLAFNMRQYINWEEGTVNFDSDEFVQLLELASIFPTEFDYNNVNYIAETELIAAGRQLIMMTDYSGDYGYIQMHRAIFGGDVVFKGFPAENRRGNTMVIDTGLAITTNCRDVDGAWEFMRTLLSKEFQQEYNWWGFPTNKAIFDERLHDAMQEKEYKSSWGWDNITIEIEPTTQKEADQILALIDSVTGTANYDIRLINLITESAAEFFYGRSTARDAARIIQNRAGIYISEQSG